MPLPVWDLLSLWESNCICWECHIISPYYFSSQNSIPCYWGKLLSAAFLPLQTEADLPGAGHSESGTGFRQTPSSGLWSCPAGSHLLMSVPSNRYTAFVSTLYLPPCGEFQQWAWLPDTFSHKSLRVMKPQISKLKGTKFYLPASNKLSSTYLSQTRSQPHSFTGSLKVTFHTKQKKLQTDQGEFGWQFIFQLHIW